MVQKGKLTVSKLAYNLVGGQVSLPDPIFYPEGPANKAINKELCLLGCYAVWLL
jgi:hypothetical protein